MSAAGLNFAFTPEQEALRDTVRRFARRELTPEWLRELDRTGRAPHAEIMPKMAALGFTGIVIPGEYGGVGGSCIDATVLLEELGRASLAMASLLNFAIGFGAFALIRFGTEAQRRFFLPGIVSGDVIFAFALTEPEAGSDAASVRTRARMDGDDFVINGTKQFITGAAEAPYLLVVARSDPQAAKRKGISLFLVNSQSPGIGFRRIEKLGMRGCGGLYAIDFDEVRVPGSALLGPLHGGWELLKATLERTRISQAAYCVGAARQTVDDALAYAGQREQFGQKIGKFQAISHLLADLHVRTESARWLVYRAAWLVDQGERCVEEASVANLHATETLLTVTSEAMRVYGGYGLTMDFDIQRHMRDARLFVIGDGSSQIQRDLIARLHGL
jgi:alkylation response protein AidB-like acyl-CoA dehydrogenase